MLNYMENYNRWINSDKVDNETKAELASIRNDESAIKLRFFQYLEFGTAGLRGTMNAGTNAMNVYTVSHATQGLANLIKKEGACDRGVAIAYDSRNNSELFSKCAASVLCANGIKVFIFDALRPTPLLSFSIRELGCIAGINITASHNPKEYNGYKAYWEDGAQLPPEHAKTVSAFIEATDIFDDILSVPFESGIKSGMIEIVGRELDEKYLENVLAQSIDSQMLSRMGSDLKIVYTPLHGAGYKLVPEVIDRLGIKNLYMVEEQSIPDGNFPTTPFPNPEYKDVFVPGMALAKKVGSDLIIATDPDADRVGIAVKGKDGEFVTMTGNQVGVLLLDYIINALNRAGKMPKHPYTIKSFVSSEMITKICSVSNIKLFNVFTGFKFIGETIKREEILGDTEFIFGFEESYGYLRGTYARDKDAVVGAMMICEMAAYYKEKNMTLYDAMNTLYEKYGYFCDGADNLYMKGLDGLEKMKLLMAGLRANPPKSIADKAIDTIIDYSIPLQYNVIEGTTSETGTGKTNTLYYKIGDDVIVIRPSGTEPKIKLYYLVSAPTMEQSSAKVEEYKKSMNEIVKEIIK